MGSVYSGNEYQGSEIHTINFKFSAKLLFLPPLSPLLASLSHHLHPQPRFSTERKKLHITHQLLAVKNMYLFGKLDMYVRYVMCDDIHITSILTYECVGLVPLNMRLCYDY